MSGFALVKFYLDHQQAANKNYTRQKYTQSLSILSRILAKDMILNVLPKHWTSGDSPLEFVLAVPHQREAPWCWHVWGFQARNWGQIEKLLRKAGFSREIAGTFFGILTLLPHFSVFKFTPRPSWAQMSKEGTLAIIYCQASLICQNCQRLCVPKYELSENGYALSANES